MNNEIISNTPIYLLTVKETSKVLHLKPSTVYEHAKQGILPAYKIGGKILFKETELFEFIECSKISIHNKPKLRNVRSVRHQPKIVAVSHDAILQKLSTI